MEKQTKKILIAVAAILGIYLIFKPKESKPQTGKNVDLEEEKKEFNEILMQRYAQKQNELNNEEVYVLQEPEINDVIVTNSGNTYTYKYKVISKGFNIGIKKAWLNPDGTIFQE